MLEFQEKRKLRKFLYSRVTFVILLIFIGIVLKAVWGVYEKQKTTKDNLAKISLNLDSLRAREKMLSSEIERLKTEDGVEEEIRDKYGLVKPGEEVIIVVGGDADADPELTTPTSFWQKIKDWFK